MHLRVPEDELKNLIENNSIMHSTLFALNLKPDISSSSDSLYDKITPNTLYLTDLESSFGISQLMKYLSIIPKPPSEIVTAIESFGSEIYTEKSIEYADAMFKLGTYLYTKINCVSKEKLMKIFAISLNTYIQVFFSIIRIIQ